ncbi:peptide N-acetyl-beta-D-glucosaminyl asparaginase amidase A-domain-containing protein [Phakopsora pachyrhizi]|nr:peptide N-acetyl-beta-D-glucosaminyl asparaginase amidase A-domain-containing protein [Phakopsora pachyrhizi]
MPILALSKADLVMRLDNIVDEKQGIDGEFVVNLDMAFYMPTDQFPAPARASAILPLSHTNATVFSIPKPATVMVQLPESTSSAFVEIYASGSAEEEYTNLLDEGKEILTQNAPKSSVNARGPFREVQLWIDDKLAGVAYPFPVVFTGGILLSWWRPISAYGSFDQPTYTIDITPFLPILTDSKKHNFTLTVEGQGPDRSTNPQWFVSGNIAIALDPSGKRTTGKILKYTNDGFVRPSGDVCQSGFFSSVDAQRKISITSTIVTGKGENFEITCTQDFQFQNKQLSETTGASQSLTQLATGSSSSQIGTVNTFFDQFSFPFSHGLKGDIGIGYNRAFRPAYYNGIPTSIQANQTATGNLLLGESGRATGGISTTGQTISYSDARGETYQRDVLVTNVTTVLKDVLSGSLANQELSTRPNQFIAQSRQLYSKPVNKSEGHKKRETLISRSEPMRLPSGLMVDRTREWQN